MSTPHNLTKAQIKALRYFAPGCKRDLATFGNGPSTRTFMRLESLGLIAWRAGYGSSGRDETTAAGLAILAEIDGPKPD